MFVVLAAALISAKGVRSCGVAVELAAGGQEAATDEPVRGGGWAR